MEKELLSIVMVLEELHSILLGAVIFIYTDHKNLTFDTFNCHCVLHWHLNVEEHGPILYHTGISLPLHSLFHNINPKV
ncbi:hypothetical protein ACHAXS_009475 [Conticribra weissflogii]